MKHLAELMSSPVSKNARTREIFRTTARPAFIVGAVAFYIAYYLRNGLLGPAFAKDWSKLLAIMMVVHATILSDVLLAKRPAAQRILFLNVAWMFISRSRLGGYTFLLGDVCYWALMLSLMYASASCLDKRWRRILLLSVALELLAVTCFWGILAIRTALVGHALPGFDYVFIVNQGSSTIYQFVNTYVNRNSSSIYFVITTALLSYVALNSKHIFWGILAPLYAVLAFVVVALQRSAAACVCLSILLSAVVAIVLLCRLIKNPHSGVFIAVSCGCALCAALMFLGLGFCANSILERGRQNYERELAIQAEQAAQEVAGEDAQTAEAPAVEEPASAAEAPAVEETAPVVEAPVAEEVAPEAENPLAEGAAGDATWRTSSWRLPHMVAHASASDEVSLAAIQSIALSEPTWADKSSSIGARMQIWKAAIQVVTGSRRTLLWGTPENSSMDAITTVVGYYYKHTHNMLIQQLVIAGVPGLILYLAFLAVLLRDAVTCVRARGEAQASLAVPSALIGVLILDGMVEPLLSPYIVISSLVFVLVAGVLGAEAEAIRLDDAELLDA